ncbi:transcription termination/antitermination NusG family protein [Aquamicrobium soli]|uniref:Transcription termination/antitermination NusG family protein n=1 Tax=Aquamicrobium soli TaxID=1811518 RepID=A0ABV7K7G1_9HYPH
MNSEKTWYLVATKPNQESLASLNLRNQGFRVLWPKLHKTIRHARKVSVRSSRCSLAICFLTVRHAEIGILSTGRSA